LAQFPCREYNLLAYCQRRFADQASVFSRRPLGPYDVPPRIRINEEKREREREKNRKEEGEGAEKERKGRRRGRGREKGREKGREGGREGKRNLDEAEAVFQSTIRHCGIGTGMSEAKALRDETFSFYVGEGEEKERER